MSEHELKTWPEFYEEIKAGRKNFEIRLNDRDYHVGDVLWLREYTVGVGFSGRNCMRTITYITDWKQAPRHVVLSLSNDASDAELVRLRSEVEQLRQDNEDARGIAAAFESVTRAIAEAIGDGDPSGPYWGDGVRFLRERAEAAESALAELRSEIKELAQEMKSQALAQFDKETSDGVACALVLEWADRLSGLTSLAQEEETPQP